MAVGYNLISCDEFLFPSRYNLFNNGLQPFLGSNVILNGDNTKRYTVERNNQVFIVFPYVASSTLSFDFSITSFEVDGQELITTPVIVSYDNLTQTLVNYNTGASIPTIFPTDYVLGQVVDTTYISGTQSPIDFTQALQQMLNSFGISKVMIKGSNISFSDVEGTGPLDRFPNYVIQKPENSSVKISYIAVTKSTIAPDLTVSVDVEFIGSTASFKLNGVETNVVTTVSAQDGVTVNKALVLSELVVETIEEGGECPCELCDNCYSLTNCDTKETLTSYSDLSSSVGKVVTLEDYEGCWTVQNCTPSVEVVVVDTFSRCKACQPNCYTPKC